MRILVMMSSYNGGQYIEQQIISILNQTIKDSIHILIRDDGSTDNTLSIIQTLSTHYPGKIDLIRGVNIGYNASFISLIYFSHGYDYYAFSDQDDVWLPCKLETAVNAMQKENPETPLLYASTSYLVRDDLIPYGQTRKKKRALHIYNTLIQNICPGHTQVMNEALRKILTAEAIEPDRIYAYDAWISSYASLYGKILFDNNAFTYYRQHGNNQFGSGRGAISKLVQSGKRIINGGGTDYRRQIIYFIEKNKGRMESLGVYSEFACFTSSRSFIQRLQYISRSRLYRQSEIESVAFFISVFLGRF